MRRSPTKLPQRPRIRAALRVSGQLENRRRDDRLGARELHGFLSRIGISYAVMLLASIPLLIVAADLGGAEGVAWVMVGNVIVMTAIVGTIAHRRIGISGWRQWEAVKPSVLATLPAWFATTGAAAALDNAPAGAALVISGACGLGAYVGGLWLLDRGLLYDTSIQLRRMLARGSAAC